jgi:hypothetical protein
MDLEAGIELRRVTETLEVGPRTRDDGDVPAMRRQFDRERPSDMRRATAGKELERTQNSATARHPRSVSASRRRGPSPTQVAYSSPRRSSSRSSSTSACIS